MGPAVDEGEKKAEVASVGMEALKLDDQKPTAIENPPAQARNEEFEEAIEKDERFVEEIESLCMNCHENGTTRLLLTKIPFFREVVLMSFYCPFCYLQNSEIQPAGVIQERGSRFVFQLTCMEDFSRQIVKSDTCTARFEELDIEIVPGRGRLTNVEGLLSTILSDLEAEQDSRKTASPELWTKIETLLTEGKKMLEGSKFPVTIALDDTAGNSSIEPSPHDKPGKWSKIEYKRSPKQNAALGLAPTDEGVSVQMKPQITGENEESLEDVDIVPDEVYSFPGVCSGCTKPCATKMKKVDIPHFKEVIIMSTVCDYCGYRSNEVKTGGEVPTLGRRITLKCKDEEDLKRDILKSESCAFSCPELELTIQPGTMGGRFTTVEGLLTQVRDDLRSQIFDIDDTEQSGGDSLPATKKAMWDQFFGNLDKAIQGEIPFTVVMEDPLASSYVQNLCTPDPDPQITIEDYERTDDEKEHLGLNDIKVEGYEDDAGSKNDKVPGETPALEGNKENLTGDVAA
ncbi:MAG: nucleolar zinc-finger protein [Trizodia sp. TS-e1964]|nr:MAG: nucleolar zinc-finger protein [Trizodia sp. TS-e1964]